jgi:hypothetical protein
LVKAFSSWLRRLFSPAGAGASSKLREKREDTEEDTEKGGTFKMFRKVKNLVNLVLAVAIVTGMAGIAHATAWTNPALPNLGPQNTSYSMGGLLNYGGITDSGSVAVSAIGTPTAPTVSQNGTKGATSAIYACSGVDLNGVATIPSSTTTTTTGNATLSATNSNNIYCAGKKGALMFLIHKADTAHVIGACYTSGVGGGCNFIDDGSANTIQHGGGTSYTYTAPTVDHTGDITGGGQGVVQAFGVATAGCTTSGAGGTCAEPTITLAHGYSDTSYSVNCTCTTVTTAVPIIQSIAKATNAIVVTIAGMTSVSAACGEVDCVASHW